MPFTSLQVAQMAAQIAADKKAQDIVLLNVGEISVVADYFLICSGTSQPHVKAIAEHLQEELKDAGYIALHNEGLKEGHWVLMDYGDLVIHIFRPDERFFYNLEKLWGGVPAEEFPAF